MKNSTRRFGLAHRISVIVTTIVVAGVSSLGVFFVFSQYSSATHKLNEEIKSTLVFATTSLSDPLWSFNDSIIDSVAKSLVNSEHQHVVGVLVLDRDVEKVAEVYRANSDPTVRFGLVKPDRNFIIEEAPIIYRNEKIGVVRVLASAKEIHSDLRQLAVYVSIFTFTAAGIIAVLIYGIMKRMLSLPLQNLLEAVRRTRYADYVQKVEDHYQDELGALATAFNEALTEIARRDHQLKNYTDRLEEMVENRTKELEIQKQNSVHNARLAAIGEVSAGIAHEVNNPLAIIDGHAKHIGLLIKEVPRENEIAMHLEKIRNMVKRVGKIVKGLRTFARDGSRDPMAPIVISKFLDDVQDLCQSKLKNSMIKLEVVNSSQQTYGFGREIQLSQVLINLVNNAADAVVELPEKWVRLETFDKDDDLVFAITDSGRGIPIEIRDRIMEPFFTTKEIGKGTGLGLSISAGIAKEHGGELVYIENAPHTRFELRLPRIDSQRNPNKLQGDAA